MSLFPDELLKQLPPLHTQDTRPDSELYAYARLTFEPMGLIWFLLELDTQDQDTFSAYLHDPTTERFGYFSFDYLEEHLNVVAVDILGDIPGEGMIIGMEEMPSALVYDPDFTPQLLIDAVKAERIQQNLRGEGLKVSATLAPHRAYYHAFAYTRPAKHKYEIIRHMVETRQDLGISAYHFPPSEVTPVPLIVVIGDRPPERDHATIMDTLAGGTPTTIAYELLLELFARKVRANARGGYQERHRDIVIKKKPTYTKGNPQRRGKKRKRK